MGDGGRGGGWELSDAEKSWLRGIVLGICRGYPVSFSGDIVDDCLLEATLCAWLIRERVARLPAPEREAYTVVCVRRAVKRVLRREIDAASHCVSLEDIDERAVVIEGDHSAGPALEDQVDSPSLVDALRALSTRDREILEPHYTRGVTDVEIAAELQITAAAAKMRRTRAMKRLRGVLREQRAMGRR
ncbi:MAG TPA: sigma-70 family RNA polymerase sigma factor [Chloroflexota bacterium]|nr:sigma-70 family RNA polymerase sigma factor [Chloroflexota bacterium]